MKQKIRITESTLRNIIRESVLSALRESEFPEDLSQKAYDAYPDNGCRYKGNRPKFTPVRRDGRKSPLKQPR